MTELERLLERNPKSHRGLKQLGLLRAVHARDERDLVESQEALQRALELNPEETGSLLALGEVALLRGDHATALERFEWACRSNPRAVGGFFLRGYISWLRGEREEAVRLLAAAHAARGDAWKPEGTAAEGDVASRMYREETPLSSYWEGWNGALDPEAAFGALEVHVAKSGREAPARGPSEGQ
jgi:tetratricopeptide (TPR) repeat protein